VSTSLRFVPSGQRNAGPFLFGQVFDDAASALQNHQIVSETPERLAVPSRVTVRLGILA
jgi:hypothetical protein